MNLLLYPVFLLGLSGIIKLMKTGRQALPTDTHALQQMVLQMQSELSENNKKLSAQDSVIDNLRHQLAVLKRARFGRSSEQVEQNIHQLE